MSNRSDIILLQDMLDAINRIEGFVQGLNETAYMQDFKTRAAVERYLEILGEAANQLTDDFYQKTAHIKWHRIIGLRNRVIHAYFEVDHSIIWNIVKEFLPPLKIEIQKLSADTHN